MSAKPKQRTCYGCNEKVDYNNLRYECMCTELKGVCKACVEKNVEITIPAEHNLTKLHDLSEEYQKYCDSIYDEIGFWNGMSTDKEGNHVYKSYQEEGKEQGTAVGVKSDEYPGTIIKTTVRPPPPDKTCICCV